MKASVALCLLVVLLGTYTHVQAGPRKGNNQPQAPTSIYTDSLDKSADVVPINGTTNFKLCTTLKKQNPQKQMCLVLEKIHCGKKDGFKVNVQYEAQRTDPLIILDITPVCATVGKVVKICLEPFASKLTEKFVSSCFQLSANVTMIGITSVKLVNIDLGCVKISKDKKGNNKVEHYESSSVGKRPTPGLLNRAWSWIKSKGQMFINYKREEANNKLNAAEKKSIEESTDVEM